MLEVSGVASKEQIEKAFPSEARMAKGPVVVVECFQNIPCNPCYTACKAGAMQPFEDINNLPTVDHELCNGCTLCVSKCPGLSIMVLDMTYSEEQALMKIPYEFLPLPEAGQIVKGLDRQGQPVCDVKVIRVVNSKIQDKTPVISIAVDKQYVKVVRNIGWEE